MKFPKLDEQVALTLWCIIRTHQCEYPPMRRDLPLLRKPREPPFDKSHCFPHTLKHPTYRDLSIFGVRVGEKRGRWCRDMLNASVTSADRITYLNETVKDFLQTTCTSFYPRLIHSSPKELWSLYDGDPGILFHSGNQF